MKHYPGELNRRVVLQRPSVPVRDELGGIGETVYETVKELPAKVTKPVKAAVCRRLCDGRYPLFYITGHPDGVSGIKYKVAAAVWRFFLGDQQY